VKRVFIVDDSFFMREMLKDILLKAEFEIAGEASDGLEALEKLREIEVDIVTLDIAMEHLNGLETLQRLKKIRPDIKVIMCSAMGQKPIIKEALENGAEDFIVKPFAQHKVIETIRKIAEKE
jgi:two-component system, chemotaxis family, chemotaxis protein CheY